MKKFFLKLVFLALFLALGFLGWRDFELRQTVNGLRGEITQLEQEPLAGFAGETHRLATRSQAGRTTRGSPQH